MIGWFHGGVWALQGACAVRLLDALLLGESLHLGHALMAMSLLWFFALCVRGRRAESV